MENYLSQEGGCYLHKVSHQFGKKEGIIDRNNNIFSRTN